jgi:hypothetical protein
MIKLNNSFEKNDTSQIFFEKKENNLILSDLLVTQENSTLIAASTVAHNLGIEVLSEMDISVTETTQNPERESPAHASSFQLTEDQIHFFTHQQPKKWYPLFRNEKGKIKFSLPSQLGKFKRLIYIFRNKEKLSYLIGKTGTSLNVRSSGYAKDFNEIGSENRAKKEGKKGFLTDVKQNPEHFEVGILHVLNDDDDLNLFETLFIDYKRKIDNLYNDHRGGGGGLAHSEETPTTYAIPKPETGSFTPKKYYPFVINAHGRIRAQFTPGYKKKLRKLRKKMELTQEFAYVIKNRNTGERYIGVSGSPRRRSREHGSAAECCDPKNERFDPSRLGGRLHPAMAANPELFEIGVYPTKSIHVIDQENQENYLTFPTIAKVEQFVIKEKKTLVSQGGLNCNRGGGGSLSNSAKRPAARQLIFT